MLLFVFLALSACEKRLQDETDQNEGGIAMHASPADLTPSPLHPFSHHGTCSFSIIYPDAAYTPSSLHPIPHLRTISAVSLTNNRKINFPTTRLVKNNFLSPKMKPRYVVNVSLRTYVVPGRICSCCFLFLTVSAYEIFMWARNYVREAERPNGTGLEVNGFQLSSHCFYLLFF